MLSLENNPNQQEIPIGSGCTRCNADGQHCVIDDGGPTCAWCLAHDVKCSRPPAGKKWPLASDRCPKSTPDVELLDKCADEAIPDAEEIAGGMVITFAAVLQSGLPTKITKLVSEYERDLPATFHPTIRFVAGAVEQGVPTLIEDASTGLYDKIIHHSKIMMYFTTNALKIKFHPHIKAIINAVGPSPPRSRIEPIIKEFRDIFIGGFTASMSPFVKDATTNTVNHVEDFYRASLKAALLSRHGYELGRATSTH